MVLHSDRGTGILPSPTPVRTTKDFVTKPETLRAGEIQERKNQVGWNTVPGQNPEAIKVTANEIEQFDFKDSVGGPEDARAVMSDRC